MSSLQRFAQKHFALAIVLKLVFQDKQATVSKSKKRFKIKLRESKDTILLKSKRMPIYEEESPYFK